MIVTLITSVIVIAFYGTFIYLITLIIKALRKYLKSADVRKEKEGINKSFFGKIL